MRGRSGNISLQVSLAILVIIVLIVIGFIFFKLTEKNKVPFDSLEECNREFVALNNTYKMLELNNYELLDQIKTKDEQINTCFDSCNNISMEIAETENTILDKIESNLPALTSNEKDKSLAMALASALFTIVIEFFLILFSNAINDSRPIKFIRVLLILLALLSILTVSYYALV